MAPLVALTGFMGSGKSTVGSALANRLGWQFVDLDQEIEATLGTTIAACLRERGQDHFREYESKVLTGVLEMVADGPLVLALGGGTLLREGNAETVRRLGTVVLLSVDTGHAWSRVAGSDRPLATSRAAFEALMDERRQSYQEVADWVIPTTGRGVEDIVADLAGLIDDAQGSGGLKGLWGRRLTQTGRPSLVVGGSGSLEMLGRCASRAKDKGVALHVVSDDNVIGAWGEKVLNLLGGLDMDSVCVFEAGEASKNVAALARCWDWLASRKARRDDVAVALGGGVIGDLAGFTAATYHRGICLWQVPTSLLAQIDSSVGGKTAVNLSAGKNLVGAFHQADMVFIDPEVLTTLPDHEYTGALGEVVKHALLATEKSLEALESAAPAILAREIDVLSRVIRDNVWLKTSVVEEDERELGRRAILNLGHTTAHALEVALGYGVMTHGHAVALGVLVALAVSERECALDVSIRPRVSSLFRSFGIQTQVQLPSAESFVAATTRDKKARAHTQGFVGLSAIGEPVWDMEVSPESLVEALEVIRL